MSKKAFPINRVNIDPPKPVRVAPNPPIALPEREPRNIWVMIGVPALIVALIGTIVMLYVSGVRSLATGFFPLMGIGAFSMLAFSGRFGRARKITWGELEKGRRRYLRDLDTNATKSRRRCVRNVNGRTPCIRTHPDWAPSLAVRGCGSVAAATSTS